MPIRGDADEIRSRNWASTPMSVPVLEKLPLRIKLGNGFGSVAYGVKDNGFATLLLLFYNQVLGLDAATVGFILLVALLLDAIVDPLVGYWSDKTHTQWGKRHPWMYAAILPMVAAWTMLWHPPEMPKETLYLYLLVVAFAMRAAVSCYEVPGLSIVPSLTADYDERTSITRWRFLFAWAGGLLMLLLAFGFFLVPTEKYPVGQLNAEGYQLYGITGGILMLIATMVGAMTTHRRIARVPDTAPTHLPLGETFRQIGRTLWNKAYLILISGSLFAFVTQGVAFSITTYMLTYFWEMPQEGFLAYSLTLFVGVIGSFLLVGVLQSRMEKRTGTVMCGIISLTITLLPYLLRFAGLFPENGSPALIPTLFTLVTISNAFAVCSMMIGQSMAADVIEDSQARTGERNEGLFFSGYFFVQKCSHGVGIFITGQIVSLSGLQPKALPGEVAMPVLSTLAWSYVAVLAVLSVISISFMSRFPITRADHQERVRRLAEAQKTVEAPAQ
jgi:glycoside/pentoside/hexuronide:cation symporter, GPH family